ncbi:hypothetical protein N7520_000487 [Penicillium odoratum]|uniref:uncharacterized protein n=1 Tax=Penicillium odoratum TaxID=1167516 RepID=UPI0025486939|nr:uncharacterized protein N7520_000487 [Penicillium odoratum]KAJ5777241.1 hypothetical protein N7520_000487 [Penicillium odoratum]
MYLRGTHAESSIKALFELIKANPLGVLTTAINSSSHPFIQSSHIPWVLDEISDDHNAPVKGKLRGHIAKQNPQSKAMIESVTEAADGFSTGVSQLQQDVMILFTASCHHYVTPKFYTETKPSTAKVVPTWNYAAAQVYGKATIYYESSSSETSIYLSHQIRDLSQMCETSIMGYSGEEGKPTAWKVEDAPERYIEIMKKNIIGIEVRIERIGGKFKMSQELGKGDRDGVMQGFSGLGCEIGNNMAALIKERGEIKDAVKAR